MADKGVAIITGGASGIGFAVAKALLGDGWKLLLADLTRPALDAASAELEPLKPGSIACVVMDVADEASVVAGLRDCEVNFGPVREAGKLMRRMAAQPSSTSPRYQANAAILAGRPKAHPRAASSR